MEEWEWILEWNGHRNARVLTGINATAVAQLAIPATSLALGTSSIAGSVARILSLAPTHRDGYADRIIQSSATPMSRHMSLQ